MLSSFGLGCTSDQPAPPTAPTCSATGTATAAASSTKASASTSATAAKRRTTSPAAPGNSPATPINGNSVPLSISTNCGAGTARTLLIIFTDRNGRDLGADAQIGNNQLLQEVYGRGQTWHLTILALDQKFLDGKLDWRIGRLPVGEDFASFSCDFQNLTFCGAQPGNIVGDYWVNWPTSQWATRLKLHTSEHTYVQIGAYQVNPNYVDDSYARHNGWKPDFPGGTTGALIPLEFGWQPLIDGLPGSYKVGVWYNTSDGADLYLDIHHQPIAITGEAPLQHDHRDGAYVNFQQQVSGTADGHGATVFFNMTQADRATSATDRQIAMGMEYKGPFDRAADSIGFALGATHANGRAAAINGCTTTCIRTIRARSRTATNTSPNCSTAGARSPRSPCARTCNTSCTPAAPARTTMPL